MAPLSDSCSSPLYVVLLAAGITTILCFALTMFAMQTKCDFTMLGGVLLVCSIGLLLFGITSIFLPVLRVFYAVCGAVLFSIYLVYHTQLMLGGKHKYSIGPEEYIFAALNLYIDIVQIFLFILTIIGGSRK